MLTSQCASPLVIEVRALQTQIMSLFNYNDNHGEPTGVTKSNPEEKPGGMTEKVEIRHWHDYC